MLLLHISPEWDFENMRSITIMACHEWKVHCIKVKFNRRLPGVATIQNRSRSAIIVERIFVDRVWRLRAKVTRVRSYNCCQRAVCADGRVCGEQRSNTCREWQIRMRY